MTKNILFSDAEQSATETSVGTVNNAESILTSAKSKSIVDFIISEREKQKESNDKHVLEQLPVMNANVFFNGEDGKSIGNKAEFLKFVQSQNEKGLRELEVFLQMMQKRTRFNITPFPVKDRAGNECYFIKIFMPNGVKELKIVLFQGMDPLIQGYLFNQYKIDLTLGELYEEAMKS